ncbi:MAG: tetratricopeptide repeat protein [Planctomycetes bacterium]|nr:tetratricopeptide repeat protein [Planctomycetota bacterium]
MRRHLILLALASSWPWMGCASHESFQTSVLRPAEFDLARYQRIAIDRFDGAACDAFVTELSDALRSMPTQATEEHFDLVDRRDVDRLIDDMRRYPSLANEPDTPLAKWQLAQLVIGGTIRQHEVIENVSTVERKNAKNPDQEVEHVRVRQARALVGVTIIAKSNDGNEILDRIDIDESTSSQVESKVGEPPHIDHAALLSAARSKVVDRYLLRIAPHRENAFVRLLTSDDLPQIQLGNGYARAGNWTLALEQFEAAEQMASGELAEQQYVAAYNRGIALLYLDRFPEARQAIERAYAASRDESMLRDLQTVERRAADHARLQEQMRTAAPGQQD